MLQSVLLQIRNKPELIVLGIMILVIAMLILPLPTYIVDLLIGLNIVISLLILMSSFYITKIIHFTSFPALLLITTLFRLALSISTSRLILLDADAGDIITSFGQFVIGDNLVVGLVIFAIVTIVQFIVITKGSERVAEVAARFSLDAMPGKQMSIDADLKSGIIDNDGVKHRRIELEQESQLYGAFDGAMKFIKGDAIAGIVIIFVNFLGGISVGMVQMGFSFSEALTTYTMLTIGDGLVAQIPALLISISAGFIVTRVGGTQKNLGQNIIKELFSHDFSLIITAVLTFIMGFLPGFPTLIFILLSILISGSYLRKTLANKKIAKNQKKISGQHSSINDRENNVQSQSNVDISYHEAVPLIISISEQHKDYIENNRLTQWLKNQILIQYGLLLSDFIINYSAELEPYKVIILVNEVRSAEFHIIFESYRVLNKTSEFGQLGLKTQTTQKQGETYYWVQQEEKNRLEPLGYLFASDISEFYCYFSQVITRNISEFFGIQETKDLLDQLERKYPELLKECYRHVSIQRITEVLQRLLQEQISIRNIKIILGGLVQWGPREKDPIMLVEQIRTLLARYITASFIFQQKLHVLIVSAELEEIIRQGIRQTSAGSFLNLEPAQLDLVQDRLLVAIKENYTIPKIVLLCSVDVRRFITKILATHYPGLNVLSFAEITEGTEVNIIKTI